MRNLFFLLAAICITAAACKKDGEKPVPPEPPDGKPGFVQLRLRLDGELLTSEGPLPYGRQFRDSTLYSVIVHRDSTPSYMVYAGGMFSHAGAISLELPVGQKFNISVRAFKKGTGGGLFYTWQNGLPYFNHFYAFLNNKLDTANHFVRDTLNWLRVTNPADSTKFFQERSFPEVDVFHGTASINVTPEPVSLRIYMKRLSFGVQLSSPNFTEGKLILEIPDAQTKSVTPADINSKHFLFATDFFKSGEWFEWPVKVKWEKPDGTIVPQGVKIIRFKRNVLTKLHVIISNGGRTDLEPVIIIPETDWETTETVDFYNTGG
jgi:hypothetical protein